MTIFVDILEQWQIADDAFSRMEQAAFAANNDNAFDLASEQRKRNDQAYFLYIFTRFEDAVNKAVTAIIANRTAGVSWADRRVWESWSRRGVKDIHFLEKVQVLTDKSQNDYGLIKSYYDGRNEIAHGGTWAEQFVIPAIANRMDSIVSSFPQS